MNKMFKKLLAVAAVVATAACLSVSVFAEGETAALTQAKDGVTVSGYAAVEGATQYTVMLFEDSFTTNYDVSKIFYINQGTNPADLLENMLFKATDEANVLPDGNYTVRIGNDKGTTVNVPLVVSSAKVMIGDIENDGDVDTDDLIFFTRYFANWGGDYAVLPNEANAQINNDGEVNTDDLIDLTRYFANWGGKYATLPVINE